ncbi:SDR family NAD(P)-dependent oxidoreductase [Flavobacterium sediminilitoris]|uniref:SDR family NAD(P)-dependent oxidoreductase n=1 Tax=Flavobacterium sediminilitoris TaxID=2024526 RepID=A0ABY4HS12_9FLAO|nr:MULTISPECIES: SDR family NAD(P)-dependent oxidoreductase [Flavobacterium]UOX34996.1 SDR family NAD(P)-dependent oxidoreductase [Flavobacterium sediminilitoris]
MAVNKQISILGCGWLGLPLAKKLIENGFSVKGSTTSENKLALLESNKIEPFLLSLFENKVEGNIDDFLNDSEILIIDIPPSLRKDTSISFVTKIKTLVTQIEKSEIKKILFVSSTSVYRDVFPIEKITEETPTNPDTESGRQLVEVEQLLLNNPNFETIILRFGGLIGEDRHPIKHLAGKKDVENPDAPINFIHQEDCIGIITAITQQLLDFDKKNNDVMLKHSGTSKQHDNFVFNAVSPEHPTREKYYQKKASDLNLALPIFTKNSKSKGKIILSTKIETFLSYTFKKEI